MDNAKSLLESNPYPKWCTDASFDEVCDAAARSFSGSETSPEEPIVSYTFRGMFPQQGHPERTDAYKFIMSFAIENNNRRSAIHFGHSISTSNEEADDTSNLRESPSLQSLAIVRECDPAIEFSGPHRWDKFVSNFMGIWLYMTARFKGTIPSMFSDSKTMQLVEERGDDLDSTLKECHKFYGPQDKHIYVFCIGTDPNYQGRGYGKQLMNQISEIADSAGQACYLECGGDKNRSFYEKFGYKVVHEQLLKDDKDGSEQLAFMMVRPAKV